MPLTPLNSQANAIAQKIADDLEKHFDIRKREVPPCEAFARTMYPATVDQWDEPKRQTSLVMEAARKNRDALRESGEWPMRSLPFAKRLSRAIWSLLRMWCAAALYTIHIQRVIDCTGDCEVLAQYCAAT